MPTATLSRRPRGLDAGLFPPPPPCEQDPPAWDIERTSASSLPAAQAERIRAAARACDTCPLLGGCSRAAVEHRPTHRCVLAAHVWEAGVPYPVEEWIAAEQAGPDIGTRWCDCCGAAYKPVQGQQRYCTQACARTAQKRRARASWHTRTRTGVA